MKYEWQKELATYAEQVYQQTIIYALAAKLDGTMYVPRDSASSRTEHTRYSTTVTGDIVMRPWHEALHDADIQRILQNTLPHLKKDHVSASNAASVSDGIVAVCTKEQRGVLELTSDFFDHGQDMMIIIAEPRAQLTIFDHATSSSFARGRTILLFAHENASIRHIQMYEGGTLYSHVIGNIETNANIETLNIAIARNGNIRTDVRHVLRGANGVSTIRNILVANRTDTLEINNEIYHNASNTVSNISAAGTASDSGKIYYKSDIVMANREHTVISGNQKAKFLVLSPGAEVYASPFLDIGHKEVTASHSVSVSHIKANDLYYPRLRGISEYEATRMLINGLFETELSGHEFEREIRDTIQI